MLAPHFLRSLERDYLAWRWRAVQVAVAAVAIWPVVMFAGWWLVGRELWPIKVNAAISRKIADGDLAQRIDPIHVAIASSRAITIPVGK